MSYSFYSYGNPFISTHYEKKYEELLQLYENKKTEYLEAIEKWEEAIEDAKREFAGKNKEIALVKKKLKQETAQQIKDYIYYFTLVKKVLETIEKK